MSAKFRSRLYFCYGVIELIWFLLVYTFWDFLLFCVIWDTTYLPTLHMLGIWLRVSECRIFTETEFFVSSGRTSWLLIFFAHFDIFVSSMCFEILAHSTPVDVFDLRIYVISTALSSGYCFHLCSTLCLVEGICYTASYGITSNSIKLPIDGRRWHDLASTRCLYIAWLMIIYPYSENRVSVWKWIHLSLAYRIVILLHVELFNLSLIRDKEIRERYFRFICIHIPYQYDTQLLWLTSFLSFFFYDPYWLWYHCWVLSRGIHKEDLTPMSYKQTYIRDYNTTFNSKP